MFGLGVWEIVVILVVALIVLGPQKLPDMAKQVGRGLREFRRAASDFQNTLEEAADDRPRRRVEVQPAEHLAPALSHAPAASPAAEPAPTAPEGEASPAGRGEA